MNVKINDNTQPTEINWDKPQLLERTAASGNKIIVLSDASHDSNLFTGMDIINGKQVKCLKEDFKPFNGTVTLSND